MFRALCFVCCSTVELGADWGRVDVLLFTGVKCDTRGCEVAELTNGVTKLLTISVGLVSTSAINNL